MNFKKIIFAGSAALMSITAMAQNLSNAILYWEDGRGDLNKAKSEIDWCTSDADLSTKPKTWYYRGRIYESIATTGDKRYASIKPGAGKIAYDAYQKVMEIDVNKKGGPGSYAKQAEAQLEGFKKNNVIINEAVTYYNEKQYDKAIENANIAAKLNPGDTLPNVIGAMAGLAMGNRKGEELALDYMEQLFFKQKFDEQALYYNYLQLTQKIDTANLTKVVNKGRELFPEDERILNVYVNSLISSKKTDEAIVQMEAALAKNPENATYLYVLGIIYREKQETEKAKTYLNKAIALDPNNANAQLAMGMLVYNESVPLAAKYNDMDATTANSPKGKALKAEVESVRKKSLPYFEKAYQLKPEDERIKDALKDVYYGLNMTKQADALD